MRFLLIDRVLEFEADRRLVAVKNVALESQYLEYHFPQIPVFPGVLLIEAMAQASGYFISRTIEHNEANRFVFAMMTANNTRFLKTVRPGDQVRIEVEMIHCDKELARTRTTAQVDGQLVSRSEFSFVLVENFAGVESDAFMKHFLMMRRILERGESLL